MSKTETSTDQPTGLIEKLEAAMEAQSGDGSHTLSSGVVATFPKFLNHGKWMQAQRQARKDHAKAQTIYVINCCKFDGEKITVAEFDRLIPTNDSMDLFAEIWDGEDNEELGK